MTKTETKIALSMLGDRVDRSETAGIDGGKWCLTVFWRDGGQRLFYTLQEVELWLANKPKRGRPATARGAYNPNPPRQLGRVSDEDWQLIRDACEASGQSLVEWALPLLLREARKLVKQSAEQT